MPLNATAPIVNVNRRRVVRDAACYARIPWDSVNLLTYNRMAGIMVLILTAEGSIAMINKSGSDMLGCASTTAVGLDWFDSFVCEDTRDQAWEDFQQKLSAGPTQAAYMEHRVTGADGRPLLIALHGTPLVDETSIVGLMAFGEDITNRRSHEVQLNERIAELRCLYGISHLKNETGQDLPRFLRECLKLIPTTTKYPRIQGARVVLDDIEYGTPCSECSGLQLSSDIVISGHKAGVVEVCYKASTAATTPGRKKTPEAYLRDLLEAIAREIGKHAQRLHAEQELIRTTEQLQRERQVLRDKNIAMREVLGQIETEKANIVDCLQTNISSSIMPVIDRLKAIADTSTSSLLDQLQARLQNAVSPFLGTLKQTAPNLTPREREICNMIRGGLSSKEIAACLSVSELTVQKQRQHIRRKLGLANQKVNLTAYLQTL